MSTRWEVLMNCIPDAPYKDALNLEYATIKNEVADLRQQLHDAEEDNLELYASIKTLEDKLTKKEEK